jgi:hypothetical protein
VFPSADSPYAVVVPGGIIDRARLDELFVGISDDQAERFVGTKVCMCLAYKLPIF